jgi:F-box/leucine-rich repeat protein 2/20
MVAQSCPLLESLNVSWCSGLDARGIRKVVETCKNLRELRACEVSKFNERGPLQALFKANKLEVLHLSGCERIDDASIRILVEGSGPDLDPFNVKPPAPPRKLVDLNLSGCSHLTDSALRSLAGHVPNLEALQLGGCAALTDLGFIALLPTLPKLTHLDIEECSELTNTTLSALARGPASKQLQHLQCSYCENMSDQGVIEIICRSPNLRNLEIDNSMALSPPQIPFRKQN